MPRILVIDDDPLIQETLTIVLEDHGHAVVAAADGRQGLKELRQGGVDLIITDVLMPESDGLEVIRAVRKEFPRLRVVAMSGGSARLPGAGALHLAQLLGASALLAKPFNQADVLAAVAAALKGQG
jgi:CheY-like chemotaxis protein